MDTLSRCGLYTPRVLRMQVTRGKKLAAKPEPGKAGIEAFFTTKGSDLFAILPRWPGRNFHLKDVTGVKAVTLLGSTAPLKQADLF